MEDPGSPCPDVEMEDPESASLQAAMDAPFTASLGPMGPLLRQLHSQPKGVGGDKIQLLKDDLVGLCISLKDVSEVDGASFMAKWWMKEVRELCYDTQDYLDEAFVKYSGAGARRSTRLRVGGKLEWRPQIGKKGQGRWGTSRLQQISTKRRNLKRRPRKAAISFRELMARVEVLGDVSERFELGVEAIKPDHAQAGVSRLTPHRSLRLHSDAGGLSLVGAEEPVNKLVDLLAFDDDSHKQLKVVSIFGFAGVGKTTAATTLYRNFKGKFQCRAFVRVSRTPDMMGILTSILSQIKAPQVRGFPDVQDLIDNIREHLQGKRYFIIIDDLWTTSVWNIINCAFPDGDCGSRIVTTTETEDISLACCSYDFTYIFQMCPLNDDQSRKLFFSRVFGSENGCPPDFREVSYGIIRKCGGSPLATVIVASMLASELNLVMEQWKTIQDSLSSIVSTNPTSEGTKEVLNLIYNYLPPHLKTCLLHLGVYPEASTIGKDDLVKQWVAEGFLGTMEESQNTEKIAGAYFDELVSRGMVQAANTNYSGEVLFCTVHQIVLDFIRDKSMEENFAITVDYFQSTLALPDKVRRLSVQFGGAKSAKIPEGIIISHVRSLLFFGFIKCVPLILGYGFLRVLILHIRADEDKIIDLSRISELCRLTYLKIKCNITIKLPAKIGGIQDLETLEVDARLFAVPSDIVHLEKLLHLRLPSESYLPHEVGHMTRLRTLGYFDIGRNSEDNVMDLCNLTNLQDLQLTCSTVQVAQNLEKNLHLLGSILEKLSILQSVTLVPTADSNAFTKKKKDSNANILKDHAGTSSTSIFCDSLSSVSLAPSHLERIELLPRICIFPILPKWFEQLGKLRTLKIAVRELRREDIHILKALPALTALSLYVQTAPAETIVFDKTGFLVLSYLKFRCTTPSLKFESDAMPNLLKLKISFNVASRVEHVTAAISIEHLSGLKEISTKIRGAGAISIEQLSGVKQISTEMRSEGADPEWAWRATIINHKNNPTMNVQLVGCFLNGNPSMETQDKDGVEDEEEEPKPNDMRTLTQPFSSSHLLTPDILLNDFLIAENAPFQSETDGVPRSENQNSNPNFNSHSPSFQQYTNNSHEIAPGFSKEKKSIEMLTEASAAEAEAVSAVASSEDNLSEGIGFESPLSETSPMTDDLDDGGPMQPDMKLHSRAFVVAKEAVGDLGCLVRQLSLDQFENESRRMHPANKDQSYSSKKALSRQRSPQGLHKKIISLLLRPRNWNAPADRAFFLDSYEVAELCYAAEQIFMQEPTVLQLKEPVKVFGDLHGQFGDLMRLFDEYGYPSIAGDITYIDYLFLGDYVDRGQHSLETITLLLALKIEYPEHVHLIRGNHEAADINALFGFRLECIERMGESDGIWAWSRFNQLFNHLPLAAMIEKKIICMHGGIGRSINSVEQIEKIERPITMDDRSIILMDLLWSNPTENNSVEGLRPNARGPGLVTFGPDRVTEFCKRNKLRLIIRAHESVMDGFERFAHGQLITLFSATNYCGTAKNAGAILVVGRGLVIVPKLIHPLPPPINSPESCPATDATWMQELNIQRPPTPTRGRPQSAGELTYDA